MKKQTKAYIYAGITVLFWSTVASAFKLTLRELDYIQLLFLASLSSTAVLFVILLIRGNVRKIVRQSGKDILRSALLGLLNPFLYYLVLFKAYSLLPAQEAQPLNFTWPVVLALLSVPLLKQKLRLKAILALLISFVGVLVISTRGDIFTWSFESPLGTILAAGSSLVWALFWIYNIKDGREPVLKLFFGFLFGTIYVSIAFTLFGLPLRLTWAGLGGAVYIGLFEMGITFVLWLRALSLADNNARVANLVYLSPFISLIFIHFVVGEEILLSSIIGLILIVAGILVQTVNLKKKAASAA
ncbi:MAG: DMT family transporter [bacterium]|nr:DMT family transporter [bacterium]